MFRKSLMAAALCVGLAAAAPASAAIYTYNFGTGGKLTIDSTAMTGSLIASDINATFSGAGLASFAGGFNIPNFTSDISINPGSWRTFNGVVYVPNANHQQKLITGIYPGMTTNQFNLWSYWGTPACPTCNYLGDYGGTVTSYSVTPSTTTGGTTTGGTTTGGTTTGGTTTGGTPVPEPGMLGLMGLGLAGMAFARRRRAKVAYNMSPLAA